MGWTARCEVFNPAEASVFHCINRCVRRCFVCGTDPLTGVNYEHRKAWIEARLKFLAGCYGIDVLGFAVLENHFHVVLLSSLNHLRPSSVVATKVSCVGARRLLDVAGLDRSASCKGKSGKVPSELARILIRLGIETDDWFTWSTRFGKLFYCMAGGRTSLAREAARRQRRWYQAPGGQLLSAIAA